MRKVQVRLPDELVEALTAEAEAEDRTLSYVVRRTLEAHVAGWPDPKRRTRQRVRAEVEKQIEGICAHTDIVKRPGASGGLVKFCSECDKRML